MGHRGGPGVDCCCGQRRQLPAAGRGARAASRRHPRRSTTATPRKGRRQPAGHQPPPEGWRASDAPWGAAKPCPINPPTQPGGPRHQTAVRGRAAAGGNRAVHSRHAAPNRARRPPATRAGPARQARQARGGQRVELPEIAPSTDGRKASYDRGRAQQTSRPVTGGRWVTAGEVHRQLWTSAEVGRGCGVGGGSPSGATPSRMQAYVSCGAFCGLVGGLRWVGARRRGGGLFLVLGGVGGWRLRVCGARAPRGAGL